MELPDPILAATSALLQGWLIRQQSRFMTYMEASRKCQQKPYPFWFWFLLNIFIDLDLCNFSFAFVIQIFIFIFDVSWFSDPGFYSFCFWFLFFLDFFLIQFFLLFLFDVFCFFIDPDLHFFFDFDFFYHIFCFLFDPDFWFSLWLVSLFDPVVYVLFLIRIFLIFFVFDPDFNSSIRSWSLSYLILTFQTLFECLTKGTDCCICE